MMDDSTWFSLRLSLQVALTATGFILIIGIPVAYLLAKRDFKGKELVDVLFTLPLVLPPTVTGYYLIILFGRRGDRRKVSLRMDRMERYVYLVWRRPGLFCCRPALDD